MSEDILDRPPPAADVRLPYGTDPSQFGELFLPPGTGPHPLVVAIHGGYWRARYDLRHLAHLCVALRRAGLAVWSLEYRRLGQQGGGWPGTFEDVARGAAHVKEIAAAYRLDLHRTITLGHSAGGHLALWLAARRKLPPDNPFRATPTLPLRGVIGLAAVSDLRLGAELRLSSGVVLELLGGGPQEVPGRYAQASPADLLPLGVAQRLLHGEADDVVPFDMSRRYAALARHWGDDAALVAIPQAGHFELIDPDSLAWPTVLGAVKAII
jgi:acetyl esterase/lipase